MGVEGFGRSSLIGVRVMDRTQSVWVVTDDLRGSGTTETASVIRAQQVDAPFDAAWFTVAGRYVGPNVEHPRDLVRVAVGALSSPDSTADRQAWDRYAAAVLAHGGSAETAARVAETLLARRRARFGGR
jgi:hypothetical protein